MTENEEREKAKNERNQRQDFWAMRPVIKIDG